MSLVALLAGLHTIWPAKLTFTIRIVGPIQTMYTDTSLAHTEGGKQQGNSLGRGGVGGLGGGGIGNEGAAGNVSTPACTSMYATHVDQSIVRIRMLQPLSHSVVKGRACLDIVLTSV